MLIAYIVYLHRSSHRQTQHSSACRYKHQQLHKRNMRVSQALHSELLSHYEHLIRAALCSMQLTLSLSSAYASLQLDTAQSTCSLAFHTTATPHTTSRCIDQKLSLRQHAKCNCSLLNMYYWSASSWRWPLPVDPICPGRSHPLVPPQQRFHHHS
jgi:hypothetical protein